MRPQFFALQRCMLGLGLMFTASLPACADDSPSDSAGAAGGGGSAAGSGGDGQSGASGGGGAGDGGAGSGGGAGAGDGAEGGDSGASAGTSGTAGTSGASGDGGSGGSDSGAGGASGTAGTAGGAGDGASGDHSGSGGSGGTDARVCDGDRWVNTDDDFRALVAEGCSAITGSLNVAGTKELKSLEGLEALTQIDTHLRIYLNQTLTSLEGLENLATIGGELELADNETLARANLPRLSTVGSLSIKGNPALGSLGGLEALASVRGEVWIRLNPSLTSLAGLSGLETVQAQLQISDNEGLTELGLENLALTGALSITWNPLLASLGNVTSLKTVEADLLISANEALTSLAGMEALEKVGGAFEVSDNDALTALGLEKLTDIGSNISIVDNDLLPQSAACALPSQLEAVNGELVVQANLGDGSDCTPCSADESRCHGIVREICDAGVFQAAATCPSACVDGDCAKGAECDYGDQRCQGTSIEHCTTEGTWLLETCFRDTCASDACVYPRCGHLDSCCALLEGTDQTECETVSASATNDECDARLRAFHEVGLCLCSNPDGPGRVPWSTGTNAPCD